MTKAILRLCLTAALSSGILALSLGQTAETAVKADTAKHSPTSKAVVTSTKLKPQTTCPIQGGPINKKLFVDYKGKRIYVCCAGCIDSVKADPEKCIAKLREMGQSVETIEATPKKTVSKAADTTMKGMDMKGMDMSKDSSMKGMDHSKMK